MEGCWWCAGLLKRGDKVAAVRHFLSRSLVGLSRRVRTGVVCVGRISTIRIRLIGRTVGSASCWGLWTRGLVSWRGWRWTWVRVTGPVASVILGPILKSFAGEIYGCCLSIPDSIKGAAQVVDILASEGALVKFGHDLVDAFLNFGNFIEKWSKLFFAFFVFLADSAQLKAVLESTVGAKIMSLGGDGHGLRRRFLSGKSEGFQNDVVGLSGVLRGFVESVSVLGFFLRCEL